MPCWDHKTRQAEKGLPLFVVHCLIQGSKLPRTPWPPRLQLAVASLARSGLRLKAHFPIQQGTFIQRRTIDYQAFTHFNSAIFAELNHVSD